MTMSARHEVIMRSLEVECTASDTDQRLVGDRSRPHALPTLPAHTTKHPDLNCISAATLGSLLEGRLLNTGIGRYMIIDSRYPYEYEAGHVCGARNIYTKETLVELCFPLKAASRPAVDVIIFHCEFSSERGPGLMRFLRAHDRTLNKDVYPNLFYPEIYLLDGGYKQFFERHPVDFLIFVSLSKI